MGVLGGKCADVELAGEWGMGMAHDCCCFRGLGGRGGYLVFAICGSVRIIEISEGVIIRWRSVR
jgi:hypothetical protein